MTGKGAELSTGFEMCPRILVHVDTDLVLFIERVPSDLREKHFLIKTLNSFVCVPCFSVNSG